MMEIGTQLNHQKKMSTRTVREEDSNLSSDTNRVSPFWPLLLLNLYNLMSGLTLRWLNLIKSTLEIKYRIDKSHKGVS